MGDFFGLREHKTTVRQEVVAGLTEAIPVFSVIALMSFTYNLGVGMTAGFVLYPLMKDLSGRTREVPPGLWVLGALSVLFFVFYPY
jgi:AGZA family xanthine/uracil permease-like MFS transporter